MYIFYVDVYSLVEKGYPQPKLKSKKCISATVLRNSDVIISKRAFGRKWREFGMEMKSAGGAGSS